jgi:5-methylphenazine-1-carboxylate 1-monooxygenase
MGNNLVMKIIINGAGIGGLVLALMLHKRGLNPVLFESSSAIKPLGVGINVQPSAIVELAELGLLEKLRATGIETAEVVYFNKFGQKIWAEARGMAAGYHVPQFSIHRGELQMLLLATVLERLGPDSVRMGFEGTAVDPDKGELTLVNRATGEAFVERADVVISADGIHSALRRQFYPNEGLPKFSGCVLWRATTIGEPFLSGRSMVMAGYADKKLVCYPISKKYADQGKAMINWIAELRVPDDAPPKDDWNREVDRSIFAPQFADWKFDWLDVPKLFAGAERVFEFPMVDRDPLPRWTHGRVTLLGDAAHPMYPIGSNGATQSILDARALADQLSGVDSGANEIHAALNRYQADRLPKTANVVMINRAQGPDAALEIVEQRAPNGFSNLEEVVSLAELEQIALNYKKVVGLDLETVNARAVASLRQAA